MLADCFKINLIERSKHNLNEYKASIFIKFGS